jgi:hypothetical protein
LIDLNHFYQQKDAVQTKTDQVAAAAAAANAAATGTLPAQKKLFIATGLTEVRGSSC